MTIFFQILIVLLILAAMVMVILGIGQLTHTDSFEDYSETSRLKDEVKIEDKVLSENNVFHQFMEPKPVKDEKKDRPWNRKL